MISIEPTLPNIVTGVFALLTSIFAVKLQLAYQKNLKLRESLNTKKQKFYEQLLSFLKEVIEGKYDDEPNHEKLIKKANEFFERAVYYSSTKVLRSLGDLMQHFYLADENDDAYRARSLKLYSELAICIRRDLGHARSWGWKKESWLDVMRISIKDINSYIPSSKGKDRGPKTLPKLTYDGKRIKP